VKLLDLFSGAGGAAMGYYRAGFTEIVGVDIEPMKRYPFQFVQDDALEYLAGLIESGDIAEFDLIHASPPCQVYTKPSRRRTRNL
jgi:DNA (cytosine-5)-methyltransferase 1